MWFVVRARLKGSIGGFIGTYAGCARGSFRRVWDRSCRLGGGTCLGVRRFSESFRGALGTCFVGIRLTTCLTMGS
jgi:hypothetical protein